MRINEFVPDSRIFEGVNKNNINQNSNEKINFYEVLKDKINGVNEKQIKSDNSAESFIKGEEVDIHNVMLKAEEAKMSMELAVQVRNKLVEAYQELSRMQL